MTINDRIRSARLERGLSLNALAKKLGVTSTCVWNWDHDNTSPRSDALPRLAQALDVNLDWLRNGEIVSRPNELGPKRGETLDSILADATDRLAGLLGIEVRRIKLTLAFDDGASADASPAWISSARHLVRQLPLTPMSSAELIAERREAGSRGA